MHRTLTPALPPRRLRVRELLAALGACALLAPSLVHAAAPQGRRGLEVGLGVGPQAGAGYVYRGGERLDGSVGDVKLTDAAKGGVAVVLDLGYRLSDHWFVGAYGQYSKVLVKENPFSCPTDFACSTQQLSFGPQVQYHFAPAGRFDPFVGLGFGMVLLDSSIRGAIPVPLPGGAVRADLDIASQQRGPELVNLTVGGRWQAGTSLTFGPFLNVTYARYTVRSGTSTLFLPAPAGGATQSKLGAVEDGPHGLVVLGFRGTYTL